MNSKLYGSTHTAPANLSLAERRPFTATAALTLSGVGLLLTVLVALVLVSRAQAATAVGLGTADSFAVLAGQGVTNTGPTVVNGDLGTSPNAAVTGFGGAPNGTVNGSIHQADTLAGQAQTDLTTAYNNAAGQGPATATGTELGGRTLTPGVYQNGTFGITAGAGPLRLNAKGNPNAVFVFKASTTLITDAAARVQLINGAQSCNIFWQIGSSATLGTDSSFVGNILALQSIQLNSGVTVDGRLLARTASVTLINDTITRAQCGTGGGSGGGSGGGNGGVGGRPAVQITGIPGAGGNGGGPGGPRRGAPCIDRGFTAKISIHAASRHMRSVDVFVNGKRIKRSTRKQFSVWVNVSGLRSGRNTIRVVAVDPDGRRDVTSRSFRRCARAVASPNFTG